MVAEPRFETETLGYPVETGRGLATPSLGATAVPVSIAALPSNRNALSVGFDFACGKRRFVGIGGPSGWGKSELLAHVAQAVSQIRERPVRVRDASEWALSQTAAATDGVLILDDLQDAVRSPRMRHLLRIRLEQRLRRNLPTMVAKTGDFAEAQRLRVMASNRWHLVQILAPTPGERQRIAHQIALEEGLKLHPSIESLIATHLNGNGRSIRGAMLRLKILRSDWQQDADFAEACGRLGPFLIGEDGWDPRDVVQEAVNYVFLAWPETPPVGRRATIAYALHKVLRLAEEDVAGFLRIKTGQVYRHCRNLNDRLDQDETASFLSIVRDHVYWSLADSAKWLE